MLPFRIPRYTISQNIMGSLYVERLFDFRIWREKEVDEDDGGDEEGEECICSIDKLDSIRYGII